MEVLLHPHIAVKAVHLRYHPAVGDVSIAGGEVLFNQLARLALVEGRLDGDDAVPHRSQLVFYFLHDGGFARTISAVN